MNTQEINQKLQSIKEWTYDSESRSLKKVFPFKTYTKNLAFVNAVAWIANKLNHHPDMEVSFDKCVIKITTHDAGGISEKDFELAAQIDLL